MAFVKTERTKCGNCVFWDRPSGARTSGLCYRYPPQEGDKPIKSDVWCGEFVDREPHSNAGAVTVRKHSDSPSPEQLRKMTERLRKLADAEDAAGCVSVGGLAADCGMLHPALCKGCGQPLKPENAWMTDGCPCNSPAGVNDQPAVLRTGWCAVHPSEFGGTWWPTIRDAEKHSSNALEYFRFREVPDPERVRAAIETMAKTMGMAPASLMKELLRTLGIDTDDV